MIIPIIKNSTPNNITEIKDILTDIINKTYNNTSEYIEFTEPLIFYNTVKYINEFDSIIIPENSVWISPEIIQKTLNDYFVFFGWNSLTLFFNYNHNLYKNINYKFLKNCIYNENYTVITGYILT